MCCSTYWYVDTLSLRRNSATRGCPPSDLTMKDDTTDRFFHPVSLLDADAMASSQGGFDKLR